MSLCGPLFRSRKRRERLETISVISLGLTDIAPKQRSLSSACLPKLWETLPDKLSSQRQELTKILGLEKSEITGDLLVDVYADAAENCMAGEGGNNLSFTGFAVAAARAKFTKQPHDFSLAFRENWNLIWFTGKASWLWRAESRASSSSQDYTSSRSHLCPLWLASLHHFPLLLSRAP